MDTDQVVTSPDVRGAETATTPDTRETAPFTAAGSAWPCVSSVIEESWPAKWVVSACLGRLRLDCWRGRTRWSRTRYRS